MSQHTTMMPDHFCMFASQNTTSTVEQYRLFNEENNGRLHTGRLCKTDLAFSGNFGADLMFGY